MHQAGQFDEAEAHFRLAATSEPSADSWYFLGDYLKALKPEQNWVGAAKAYRKALELAPDHALAHNALGHTLRRCTPPVLDAAGAAHHFRKTISLDPTITGPRMNLASSLKDLGKYDEAEEVLREAMRIAPEPKSKNQVREMLGSHIFDTRKDEVLRAIKRSGYFVDVKSGISISPHGTQVGGSGFDWFFYFRWILLLFMFGSDHRVRSWSGRVEDPREFRIDVTSSVREVYDVLSARKTYVEFYNDVILLLWTRLRPDERKLWNEWQTGLLVGYSLMVPWFARDYGSLMGFVVGLCLVMISSVCVLLVLSLHHVIVFTSRDLRRRLVTCWSLTDPYPPRRIKHRLDVLSLCVLHLFYLPVFLKGRVILAAFWYQAWFERLLAFVGVGLCCSHYLVGVADIWLLPTLTATLAVGCPMWWWTLHANFQMSFVVNEQCFVCHGHRYRPTMVRCKDTFRVYCSKECSKRDPTLRAAKAQARRDREHAGPHQ